MPVTSDPVRDAAVYWDAAQRATDAATDFVAFRERQLLDAVFKRDGLTSLIRPIWAESRSTDDSIGNRCELAEDFAAWIHETATYVDATLADVIARPSMRDHWLRRYCAARAEAECEQLPAGYLNAEAA